MESGFPYIPLREMPKRKNEPAVSPTTDGVLAGFLLVENSRLFRSPAFSGAAESFCRLADRRPKFCFAVGGQGPSHPRWRK